MDSRNDNQCLAAEVETLIRDYPKVPSLAANGEELDTLTANALQIVPPHEMTDEEFLDQAEDEIRRSDKRAVFEILAIGKKLAEIKTRVGHGRYGVFIRDRLWFSERSAQQYVQSYEFLKSAQCADFESLHIDASAIRLLARPSIPNEVRIEALERAAKPEGLSYSELKKLIANAEITKAKDEVDKEANEAKTVEASAALVQRDEWITDFKCGTTAIVVQPVRAKSDTEIILSQEQPPAPEVIIEEFTPSLKKRTSLRKQRDDAESEIADVGLNHPAALRDPTAEAIADAIEPSNLPGNSKLLSMVMETRRAIIQCAEQTKLLLPAEYIKIETKEHLEEIAMAIAALTRWLRKSAKGVKGRLSGPGVAPSAADVSPATLPDQDPAEIPPTPKKRQLSLTLAEPSCVVDQTHDTVTTKSARGRPVGSADNQPCKPKAQLRRLSMNSRWCPRSRCHRQIR